MKVKPNSAIDSADVRHVFEGKAMKPRKKAVPSKHRVKASARKMDDALVAENLKLQRKIEKDRASIISLKHQVQVLQGEVDRLRVPTPSMESLLGGDAADLLTKIQK